MNIFEQASRQNLTYSVKKGVISFNDLWGYSKQSLAELGKALKAELTPLKSDDDEFSLVPAKTNKRIQTLELQIAIVKHIFTAKTEEEAARDAAQAKQNRRDQLQELIREQKSQADRSKSLEELEKELAELNSDLN